jgi:hypothetical protein
VQELEDVTVEWETKSKVGRPDADQAHAKREKLLRDHAKLVNLDELKDIVTASAVDNLLAVRLNGRVYPRK